MREKCNDVVETLMADGIVCLHDSSPGDPGGEHGNVFRSLWRNRRQTFAIDFQQTRSRNVRTSRRTSSRTTARSSCAHRQCWATVHAQSPVHEKIMASCWVNVETREPRSAGTKPVRAERVQLRLAHRRAHRPMDQTIVSSGHGMGWIDMGGIMMRATTPNFLFLQDVLQRTLDTIAPAFARRNGRPSRQSPDAIRWLEQGVDLVDGALGSGYAQQWTRRSA